MTYLVNRKGRVSYAVPSTGPGGSFVAAPRFFICTGNMREKWVPGSLGHTKVT